MVNSTTYLVRRLTGETVIDHYTAANVSPLYDVGHLAWTDELAPDLLPLERLPRLAWSTEVAGHVTATAAQETGLAEGTPVAVGTVDAAAEVIDDDRATAPCDIHSVGASQPATGAGDDDYLVSKGNI